MKRLIVMCGLPGSGKSTYARHLAEKLDKCEIISSDAIRAELYGDERIQGDPIEVFSIAHQRIIDDLKEVGVVIFDATNILSKHRFALLNLVKNRVSKVHAELYVLVEPYETLIARDAARERSVGDKVILKMMTKFQVPDLHKENWDEVHIINDTWHSIEHFSWVMQKACFDQKNPHHSKDLYGHCLQTSFNMAKYLDEEDDKSWLLAAAFLHDYGKYYTQMIGEDGIAHYPGHTNVSAYYCLMCIDCKYDCDIKRILDTALLVEKHMIFFNKKINWKRFTETYGEEFVKELEMLHKADVEAH